MGDQPVGTRRYLDAVDSAGGNGERIDDIVKRIDITAYLARRAGDTLTNIQGIDIFLCFRIALFGLVEKHGIFAFGDTAQRVGRIDEMVLNPLPIGLVNDTRTKTLNSGKVDALQIDTPTDPLLYTMKIIR